MFLKRIVYFSRKTLHLYLQSSTMSTFTSRINMVTGNNEWIFVDDDDFDYNQELARSAFADMLHDHERNIQYEQAIIKTIQTLSKSTKKIHVLDIGTGTGLLSMMAARAFNQTINSSCSLRITACEVFQPMAKIAKKCIEKNALSHCIRVIDKRSTELDLENDLQGDRINIIVAEVFDTELIGEGALRTFSEACKHLTIDNENLRIIPARATIYVQLVQSSFLQEFHTLKNLSETNQKIKIPDGCRHLAGNTIFDLNANEIKNYIRPLSKPIPVFDFDFKSLNDKTNFTKEKILENIQCDYDGQIDAFVMWWNLDMDEQGEIQLGTIPSWCYDDKEKEQNVQWREHWIHAIYYPQQPKIVKAKDQVSLYCFHDEYSLYFDVGISPFPPKSFTPAFLSRSAVAGFNNDKRRNKYIQALEKSFSNPSINRCLYIGDGLLLPLLILEMYPNIELIILQSSNIHLAHTLEKILTNSSKQLNYRIIPSLDKENIDFQTIDMILSEPFFTKSILPWDNLHFYYLIQQYHHSNIKLFPSKARIRCIALEFDNLYKIRSPVNQCCQFDLTPFDEQILQASLNVDATIEPQSLFEYSSKKPTLSSIIDLIEIDLEKISQKNKIETINLDIPFNVDGICNGIAFWIDYQLEDNIWLTTGIENENDSWANYSKQGVHLLLKPIEIKSGMKLSINAAFDFQKGQFSFNIIS
ncbi:unnamed protein product [Adineta steineri]|uniref:Protein arginine N-methyltransferase n=1 Tax=Adineta steineri TaxID=433720 RepID=A0A814I697_9BILA|nr:unnamed protein product [Adineta steineri]CAF1215167.1 unnamed protein product [Adineta steineri]